MNVSCDTLWEDKSCNIPDITEHVSPCVQTSTICPDPPPETNNTTYQNQSSIEPASTDHETKWEVGFWCVSGILLLSLLVSMVLLVIINLKCSIGVEARRKAVECCEWIISKLKPDTQKMDNISDNNSGMINGSFIIDHEKSVHLPILGFIFKNPFCNDCLYPKAIKLLCATTCISGVCYHITFVLATTLKPHLNFVKNCNPLLSNAWCI